MKLSEWAKEAGIHYQTAWRWWRAGKLPVPAYQTETGTVIVVPEETEGRKVVGYARVSSADQKADLQRQVARIAQGSDRKIDEYVTEVGSALNGARPKLKRLLSDPYVGTIVVEHRDRLVRFGFEYIEAALTSAGRSLVVLDDTEVEDDLVRDATDVLTSLCARLYGRRGAKNRAKRAIAEAKRT